MRTTLQVRKCPDPHGQNWNTFVLNWPTTFSGTIEQINLWAKENGLSFVRDTTVFGGHFTDTKTMKSWIVT